VTTDEVQIVAQGLQNIILWPIILTWIISAKTRFVIALMLFNIFSMFRTIVMLSQNNMIINNLIIVDLHILINGNLVSTENKKLEKTSYYFNHNK